MNTLENTIVKIVTDTVALIDVDVESIIALSYSQSDINLAEAMTLELTKFKQSDVSIKIQTVLDFCSLARIEDSGLSDNAAGKLLQLESQMIKRVRLLNESTE